MKTLTTTLIAIVPLFALAGCDFDNSPKEEGKELIQSVKDGDDVGEISEEAGELVESVGEKAKDTVNDSVDDASDKVEKEAEKAGDAVEDAFDGK